MQSAQSLPAKEEQNRREALSEAHYETWAQWPVHWSAVWVGALAALAAVLLFGLIGVGVGVYLTGPGHRVVDVKTIGTVTLIFSVASAFLAFVIGGWVAAKVAGILRAEPAMLHGAITWLVAVPLLVALATLGASNYLGNWFAGLAGSPAWASAAAPFDRPLPPAAGATDEEKAQYREDAAEYRSKVEQWREDGPRVARNSALGAATALLLGLVGSVIGGWMACGEPMTFTRRADRSSASGVPARQDQNLVRV
jgi:hypothetical protein